MKNLYIIGAGGLGRNVLSYALDIMTVQNEWRIKGFLNSQKYIDALDDIDSLNYKICESLEGHRISEQNVYVFAISDVSIREKMCKKLKDDGAVFVNIIHPTAIISKTAVLGEGIIIAPYSTVGANAIIEDFVFVDGGTIIGHDAIIREYSSIGPHCSVLGHCTIERKVTLGSNATIHPHIHIGEESIVGIGSVVVKNVRSHCTVFGVPAMKL